MPESPRRTGEATAIQRARHRRAGPPHGWRTALAMKTTQPRESAHRKPSRNEREERWGMEGRQQGQGTGGARPERGRAGGRSPCEWRVRKRTEAGRGGCLEDAGLARGGRCPARGGRCPAREDAPSEEDTARPGRTARPGGADSCDKCQTQFLA